MKKIANEVIIPKTCDPFFYVWKCGDRSCLFATIVANANIVLDIAVLDHRRRHSPRRPLVLCLVCLIFNQSGPASVLSPQLFQNNPLCFLSFSLLSFLFSLASVLAQFVFYFCCRRWLSGWLHCCRLNDNHSHAILFRVATTLKFSIIFTLTTFVPTSRFVTFFFNVFYKNLELFAYFKRPTGVDFIF